MIAFDFSYFRPDTLKEAVEIWSDLKSQGKTSVYYSGGSEIITMCRAGSIKPDAVIDIKNIAECKGIYKDENHLHIGSVCTLYEISKSKLFPLLGLCCGRIADHTNQCRITLGGNLSGTIMYRETSLALLVSDALISVPLWALSLRYTHIKKTTNEKIDYPLLSLGGLVKDDKLRIAFSGLFAYPFRCEKLEEVLNDKKESPYNRAKTASSLIRNSVLDNTDASKEYRLFVFENTIQEVLEAVESGKI